MRWVLMAHGLPIPEPNPDLVDEVGQLLAKGDLVYQGFKVLVVYNALRERGYTGNRPSFGL